MNGSTDCLWELNSETSRREFFIAFAQSEDLAAEIKDKFALHLSITASQIGRVPVGFVQGLPAELRERG
ncbi:hypothetical protein [Bradyrhizobium sp. AZCC 2289]|uniref:hypothetical protein n=1 Tax=Bradyrhizobium sp. AZCC 2289 TaxID=3117026 RepID=UPI002FEF0F1C